MALLFEYGKWASVKDIDSLKQMLKDIWQRRLFVDSEIEISEAEDDSRFQPFLSFDNNQVRANNFVGFIQNDKEIIEIYPKVFRNYENAKDHKELMLKHIFFWFSYCRKWKFPFNQTTLDTREIEEFPELIINVIANQFLDTISKQPLTMYQPVEEVFQAPRGSINFKRYINNGITTGNYHKIDCDYEPFLFDNKVNRIIKYCTRLLLLQTRYAENQRILQDIVFILDEVEDLPCSVQDIERTNFNPFFEDYASIMNSCNMILSQQLYSNNLYNLSQWCLLFPMEYIFEDFFAGFLQEKLQSKWKVEYQKSEKYLARNEDGKNVFNMQHDIFLTSKEHPDLKIIADTKYKLRDSNFKIDPKKGIAQNDLYQMVSYAFKRGCTDIMLVYPNLSDDLNKPDKFEVVSGFPANEKIKVTAIEIPFWSFTNFDSLTDELVKVVAENLNDIIQHGQSTRIS
jgi:5-methylcytosine-specific restriction enzyme subunit McrC